VSIGKQGGMNRAERREWVKDYRDTYGVNPPDGVTAEEVIAWQAERVTWAMVDGRPQEVCPAYQSEEEGRG